MSCVMTRVPNLSGIGLDRDSKLVRPGVIGLQCVMGQNGTVKRGKKGYIKEGLQFAPG